MKGVKSTRVGYIGGHTSNATYKKVCSGKTGHAEAVEITYDPSIVAYSELLDMFWKNHNPTTLNRQGYNVGYQYRSAIFYLNDEQKEEAIKSKDALEQSYTRPIVTEISKATEFWEAEEYHQQYIAKQQGINCEGCSQKIILPK